MDTKENVNLGVAKELGDLPADALISEEGLAKIFRRDRVSIKRAIQRGELPASIRLLGQPVWTVRALREHSNRRLDQAKRECEQLQRKISEVSA